MLAARPTPVPGSWGVPALPSLHPRGQARGLAQTCPSVCANDRARKGRTSGVLHVLCQELLAGVAPTPRMAGRAVKSPGDPGLTSSLSLPPTRHLQSQENVSTGPRPTRSPCTHCPTVVGFPCLFPRYSDDVIKACRDSERQPVKHQGRSSWVRPSPPRPQASSCLSPELSSLCLLGWMDGWKDGQE